MHVSETVSDDSHEQLAPKTQYRSNLPAKEKSLGANTVLENPDKLLEEKQMELIKKLMDVGDPQKVLF